MTLHVHTYYCARCHAPTPHETGADRHYCIPCAERKNNRPGKFRNEPNMSAARFAAALDGAGNRGESKGEKKCHQRKSN